MLQSLFVALTSIAAPIVFAFAVSAYCIGIGRHRTADGALSISQMRTVFLLAAAFYTIAALSIGNLVFRFPIEEIIGNFGSGRVGWVFLGVAIENFMRLWTLLDEAPRS